MNLALHIPARRTRPAALLSDADLGNGSRNRPKLADSLACYGSGFFGIGGSDSQTQTSSLTSNIDQRVAASEGSLAVGKGATYTEAGGLNLAGASDTNIEAGERVNAGGDINVNDSDVLKTALAAYNEQSQSNVSAFSSFAKQLEEQKAADLATALGAIGQLKQDADEQAQSRKTFTWLAVAVLAVIALLFFPWKDLRRYVT